MSALHQAGLTQKQLTYSALSPRRLSYAGWFLDGWDMNGTVGGKL
jgi:hypothetical protein